MIFQPILFPKENICKEIELYYRSSSKQFGNHYDLQPNQQVSFDTYFNSFSIDKWKEYTLIKNLYLHLEIEGNATIDLFEATIDEEKVIEKKINSFEKDFSTNQIDLIFPNFDKLHGICYFTITAGIAGCKVLGGSYSTETNLDSVNSIKLGIGICTYKREQFLLKNLETIQENIFDNPASPLASNLEIFVSDNGQTLNKYGYKHPKVRILPNLNAGGAGGFTRCMIEALKENNKLQLTHLILMDDDIVLDPRILERTYYLLQFLKKEHLDKPLGGIMIKLETPYEANTFGDYWTFNLAKPTERTLANNYDLRPVYNIINSTRYTRNNFNGWWYCCYPMSFIRNDNLPIPYFLHCDDVEYGIRTKKEFIIFNGIAIWHSFINKHVPSLTYYDLRNRIVLSFLRAPQNISTLKQILKIFTIHYLYAVTQYEYVDWKMVKEAISDVFKGPEHFSNIKPTKKHAYISSFKYTYESLQEVSSKEKTLNFKSDDEIKVICAPFQQDWRLPQKLEFLKNIQNIFPHLKKDTLYTNYNIPSIFFRRKKVVIFEDGSAKGLIHEYSLKNNFYCTFSYIWTFLEIILRYRSVKKAYKKAESRITHINFWRKYLKLDE